jgi:acyl carrier protein
MRIYMNPIQAEDLRPILSEVFPAASLPQDVSLLKMGDIEAWDSLGNFNLLLAIEERFDVRFTMDEMADVKSVAGIVDVLKAGHGRD